MGLFDVFQKKPPTHEEKLDLAYRYYKPDMVGMVFPGGKRQVNKIICSIAKLVSKNLSTLDAKDYYDLLSIYSDVLIHRVVTHSTDDSIISSLLVKHSQDIRNKAVAQRTLAYCTINMNNHDFCLDSAESMIALRVFENVLSQNEQIAQSNSDAQTKNLDDPDYGLVPEKPIYVNGVEGSEVYLKTLRLSSGESLFWKRTQSLTVDNINGMVDVYEVTLSSGKPYKTIYLNMYATKNSTKAPQGFTIKGPNNTPCIPEDDYIPKEIIPHINRNIANLLIRGYEDFVRRKQSTAHTGTSTTLESYERMKDMEEHIVALANYYTLDKKKTYLKLVEECFTPPIVFSEGLCILAFANKLKERTATTQDAAEFESHVITVKERKDPHTHYDFRGGDFVCPCGPITQKDIERYERELYDTISHTSARIGGPKWFRKYWQLSSIAFNYAQNSFQMSNGRISITSLPGFSDSSDQMYPLLFAQAFHAGILAAETYCKNNGATQEIEHMLNRKSFNEIIDTAKQTSVYYSHNDDPFSQVFAPILKAAIDHLTITKPNAELHSHCLLVSLKAVFEFGAGLYFE